jgi:hypothetical protein
MAEYLWVGLSGVLLIATVIALAYFTRPTLRHSRESGRR